mmetsp:Transcript_32445/g.93477  ORF Transcript_32445/g.93477 Transcript_32445/m.93477 type:complete len:131 (-) Transcript_32445:124-516(-)
MTARLHCCSLLRRHWALDHQVHSLWLRCFMDGSTACAYFMMPFVVVLRMCDSTLELASQSSRWSSWRRSALFTIAVIADATVMLHAVPIGMLVTLSCTKSSTPSCELTSTCWSTVSSPAVGHCHAWEFGC